MESVTLWRGAAYRHVEWPARLGPLACPGCGGARVAFHSFRRRAVEHPDAERPTYLLLKLAKYRCDNPACARKYFTPEIAEAAPHARTSRRLQQVAAAMYRAGDRALRAVAGDLRGHWQTGTGKSGVLRWHRRSLARDYPHPGGLPFSKVLCIDEVYDRVGGRRQPIFTCVDPLAGITIRIPVERADADSLAQAMRQVRELGADPEVVVSDLWAAYPDALRQVWPRAERQLCWFHVMQWVTRKLAELLARYGETLPAERRAELNRLRFRLLASPDRQARFTERERAALERAWELARGTVAEEALLLRDQLRALVNHSTSRSEAWQRFDELRRTWPQRFRPWDWCPGEPLPGAEAEPAEAAPEEAEPDEAAGLRAYLEQIMAFFVRHFSELVTYLGHPGVPRTSNAAERANRRYRAVARVRYGWATAHGLRAMLVALQGFDSS
ncbi:MAG TPA: transposase [Streptosporangiaceae bacterium]